MEFILRQIITNSMKYRSGETLQLVFRGRREENAVCLDITDGGIGIQKMTWRGFLKKALPDRMDGQTQGQPYGLVSAWFS